LKGLNVTIVADVCRFLDELCPSDLAESWDNTGLLLGDGSQPIRAVMTCLTITPESVEEAVARQANLIVSHHPLPFRPLARITTDSQPGRLLWRLAGAGVSVYSPHTRFDSAACGINEMLSRRLGLTGTRPLVPQTPGVPDSLGSGRCGRLGTPMAWGDWVARIKSVFGLSAVRAVARTNGKVSQVALACGSGGSLLGPALEQGCDTFVTGEMSFHSCLEARAAGAGVILLGHYQSERIGVESLADQIRANFAGLSVWASERESDPICSC
jgi:dinuclear metal center YbgI/SA1388 family protein